VKPKYDPGVIDTWWYDSEKAGKLTRAEPAVTASPGARAHQSALFGSC
jgi:hypothetical protein